MNETTDTFRFLAGRQSTSRRTFLKRSAILGISVPVIGSLLSACGDDDDTPAAAATSTPSDSASGDATVAPSEPTATAVESDTDPAASGGTLIIDLGSEPENLDVHQQLAATTSLLTQQICEALLTYAPGTLEVAPSLAESWETSDDALTYTYTLREDVTFHDGSPFNAEAVKFSFERQLDKDNPYNAMGSFTGGPNSHAKVEEITVDSEFVVSFHLSSVLPAFNDRMTTGYGAARIVSPAAVMEYGEDYPEHPTGTGPYKFNRWDKGQQVVLDRNEDWWGGTPGLDQVVWRAITEDGTRLAALLSNEVQFTVEVSPEIVASLANSNDHHVEQGSTGSIWFLAINTNSTGTTQFTAFEDLRVRQAIAHAIDKDMLVEGILNNTVELAQGVMSPAWNAYNPAVEGTYPYDPDKARELLAEANWDSDLEVVLRSSDGGSGMLSAVDMTTVIQDNLSAVGIKTRIEVQEFVAWMDAIRNPQNQLTIMSWNVPPAEPDRLLNGILSESALPPGFNTSYWVDEEFEEVLEQGRTSIDPDEVKEAYQRAQMIVVEQVPIVPVCHRQQLYGISNRVKGFEAMPSMLFHLANVTIEN